MLPRYADVVVNRSPAKQQLAIPRYSLTRNDTPQHPVTKLEHTRQVQRLFAAQHRANLRLLVQIGKARAPIIIQQRGCHPALKEWLIALTKV